MKFCVTMCLTFLMIFIDYAKAFDCVDHNKWWKIIKEMGISDHLTCLLRNLYAGQEATVRTGHGTTDWFVIEKGVLFARMDEQPQHKVLDRRSTKAMLESVLPSPSHPSHRTVAAAVIVFNPRRR